MRVECSLECNTAAQTSMADALAFVDVEKADDSDDGDYYGKDDDRSQLITDSTSRPAKTRQTAADEAQPSQHSFYQFAYYQRLFDVDSRTVARRLLSCSAPRPQSDFLADHVKSSNPDLYGESPLHIWRCI